MDALPVRMGMLPQDTHERRDVRLARALLEQGTEEALRDLLAQRRPSPRAFRDIAAVALLDGGWPVRGARVQAQRSAWPWARELHIKRVIGTGICAAKERRRLRRPVAPPGTYSFPDRPMLRSVVGGPSRTLAAGDRSFGTTPRLVCLMSPLVSAVSHFHPGPGPQASSHGKKGTSVAPTPVGRRVACPCPYTMEACIVHSAAH
ncbi:hypothetical protein CAUPRSCDRAFT_11531 [Caulochytrium protostelioides]|uniref:Uncharacterized protein n=1 Tax=Caulochytrium protostelioides TaxID=1555241 RepID=A0A4V1ITE5_9FUNG|nr:hypothetical protein CAUPRSCDRAFT_11531 [Caulochytrium protostelioides]